LGTSALITVDDRRGYAFHHVGDPLGFETCLHEVVTDERRVLLAIEPPLLADLLRRALESDDIAIDLTGSNAAVGYWDVAVLSTALPSVRARYVVDLSRDPGAFEPLVDLVRALARS
jgi:hypothetical protein